MLNIYLSPDASRDVTEIANGGLRSASGFRFSPSYSRCGFATAASMQYFGGSPTHEPVHMWSPGVGLSENEYIKGSLPGFQRIAPSTNAARANHYGSGYSQQVGVVTLHCHGVSKIVIHHKNDHEFCIHQLKDMAL